MLRDCEWMAHLTIEPDVLRLALIFWLVPLCVSFFYFYVILTEVLSLLLGSGEGACCVCVLSGRSG